MCLTLWVRKYLQFYAEIFCSSKPMQTGLLRGMLYVSMVTSGTLPDLLHLYKIVIIELSCG